MLQKITLIGTPNVGKTTTLRMLIYLFISDSRFQSIQLFEHKKKEGKEKIELYKLVNGNFFDKQSIANNISSIFRDKDIRVAITLSNGETEHKIAIATSGDDAEIVRLNWLLFNVDYQASKFDFDVCVSPCHKNDSSTDQEEMQCRWRINSMSSVLLPISIHTEYLLKDRSTLIPSINNCKKGHATVEPLPEWLSDIIKRPGTMDKEYLQRLYSNAKTLYDQINDLLW